MNLLSTGSESLGPIGIIPAIGISRESSQLILRQLEKGPVFAKLHITNIYGPNAVSHNVVADIPGMEHPDKINLVGGHYDGYDISVGAMTMLQAHIWCWRQRALLQSMAGLLNERFAFVYRI